MPVAWFICPYITEYTPNSFPLAWRHPCFKEFWSQIHADGGAWAGSECLGDHLVAKIKASATTLNSIAGLTGVIRIPKVLLSESLSDLSTAQRNALSDKLQAMGYPLTEIRSDLGNDLRTKTLGDVLRFAAKRRNKPRVDEGSGIVVFDGPEQPIKPIEVTDGEVI